MANKAVELFHVVPRSHNCAQAVAVGLGREELCQSLGNCGGGNAPGGLCGALYAAMLLTAEKKRDQLKRDFAATAGSPYCRELKNIYKTPCVECVRLGAELAEKMQ